MRLSSLVRLSVQVFCSCLNRVICVCLLLNFQSSFLFSLSYTLDQLHPCFPYFPASVSSWAQNIWNVPSPPTSHSQLREIGMGSSPTVTSRYLAASLGAMTESERAQPGWAQTPLDDCGSPAELCMHLIRSCARESPLPHPRTDSETISEQHIQRL